MLYATTLVAAHLVLWVCLGLVCLVSVMAILSPRAFSVLALRGSRWVDTSKVVEVLDRRIDIDRYVLPFSRLLGVAVVTAVAVLAFVLIRYM